MGDVHAKLAWAEWHLERLTNLGRDFLRPRGGDDRPLGITFDHSRPPLVVAKFIAEEPMPIEISLHAGDCVHNTRSALDHVLARMKDHYGGDIRTGTFPITQSDNDWKGRIYPKRDGRRLPGALDGLPCKARVLIYREQPHIAYAGQSDVDPIAVLSTMDNTDKHRLLQHGFAYPAVDRGLDLIEVRNRGRVFWEDNVWVTGEPLEDGTVVARFRIRGRAQDVLRVNPGAELALATGPLGARRTTYREMIARVRGIADRAAGLMAGGS